jgi:hypothetical protein
VRAATGDNRHEFQDLLILTKSDALATETVPRAGPFPTPNGLGRRKQRPRCSCRPARS